MNELMVRSTNAINTISDCHIEDCRISDRCKFRKVGKCGVQVVYANEVAEAITGMYKGSGDAEMFRIAAHLMPLYIQLGKLQMIEMGVNYGCYEDAKGNMRMHPVFKEIRETLKTIAVMWRELAMYEPVLPRVGDVIDGTIVGDVEKGNPNYYEEISKERKNIARIR